MLKWLRDANKTSSGGSGFIGIFDEVFAPSRSEMKQEVIRPRPSRQSPDPEPKDGEGRFAGKIRIVVPG